MSLASTVNALRASFVRLSPNLQPLFRDLRLELRPGRIACVTGENGCGKTTLSYLVGRFAPLLVLHRLDSDIGYDGNGGITRAGAEAFWAGLSYTFQDPDSQYSELRVRHELDRTIPGAAIRNALIARYELGPLLDRGFAEMSYGERQRALWARDFGADRRVYLLDEVGSYLDEHWQEVLSEDLETLRTKDRTVCLFGHPGARLAARVTDWYTLDGGWLVPGRATEVPEGQAVERTWPKGAMVLSMPPVAGERRRGKRVVRCPVGLELGQGDIGVIQGANGTGKTSLLMAICGLLGRRHPGQEYGSSIKPVLVMQNPYSQTIDATLTSMLRGVDTDHVVEVFPWLERLEGNRDPLSLSYGEQKVIHILRALHSEVPLVAIDELATGLSRRNVSLLCGEIVRACRDRRKAVLLSSHPGVALPLPITVQVNL